MRARYQLTIVCYRYGKVSFSKHHIDRCALAKTTVLSGSWCPEVYDCALGLRFLDLQKACRLMEVVSLRLEGRWVPTTSRARPDMVGEQFHHWEL